jgi:hypothetical protein
MKLSKPSPAMVVAIIALVMAMTGSAAAVVSFARNAGAVDGKSAVASGASNSAAAGKLVATLRSGKLRGRIPSRYLSLPKVGPFVSGTGAVQSIANAFDVVDNATAAPVTLVDVPGFGTVASDCNDQATKAGVEDPQSNFTFTNQSGAVVNIARTTGTGGVDITNIQPATVYKFTYNGSNTFTLSFQKSGVNLVINGVVRQDGKGTASAGCLVYGTALRVFG